MSTPSTEPTKASISERYTVLATILFNALLLFFLLNLAATAFLQYWGSRHSPMKYPMEDLRTVYPGQSEKYIRELLEEVWTKRRGGYDPYTQFREAPYKGKHLTVHPAGFRHSANQGPWPPNNKNFNIFFFGGSTSFGSGVSDDATVASHLQQTLVSRGHGNVRIYNFGVGGFYSTQERIRFERLITAGHVPDFVVFLDGLNDCAKCEDVPTATPQYTKMFSGSYWKRTFQALPVTVLLNKAKNKFARDIGEARATESSATLSGEDCASRVIPRWLANKWILESVAKRFGAPVSFVWQPAPVYGYDLKHHPFLSEEKMKSPAQRSRRAGYARVAKMVASGHPDLTANFLWLGDLQRERQEPLYVDMWHYTSAFANDIAQAIADHVEDRGILPAS